MNVEIDPSTRKIFAYGHLTIPSDPSHVLVEINDKLRQKMNTPDDIFLSVDETTVTTAPRGIIFATPPPPPPPPDIAGLVKALMSSPNIDQPTKDALVAALEGT